MITPIQFPCLMVLLIILLYHKLKAVSKIILYSQIKNNTKYSVDNIIDNKYLEDVKNNDLETVQFLV